MKILALSDKVLDRLYRADVAQRYRDITLVIGCGDLPYYYLSFLASALDRQVLFVHGNHDAPKQFAIEGQVLTQVDGGLNLHGRLVQCDGLHVAGLEGSMRYKRDAPRMYTETEMTREALPLIYRLWKLRFLQKQSFDLFVSHSPAFGLGDQDDRAHTGFRLFRRLYDWFQPRYHLHGHVHHYRSDHPRVLQYRATTIINVYPRFVLDLDHPPEPQAVVTPFGAGDHSPAK